jgi:hypothetical protein
VFASGFGGKANRKNACLLFNILHREESVHLLAEAARVERPRGSVLVIHPGTTDLQAEKLPPSAFASFRWPTGSGKTTQSQLTLKARKNDRALVVADGSVKRIVPVVLVTSRNGNQLTRLKDR